MSSEHFIPFRSEYSWDSGLEQCFMDRLMIGSQFGTKTCKFVTEKHTSHISFNKSGKEAMTRIRNSITSNLSEQSSNSVQIISRHVSKWRAWKIRWNIRRGKLSQKSIKLSQNLQRLREIFRDTKSGKWTLI